MKLSARFEALLNRASRHPGTAGLFLFIAALLVRGIFALWLPNDILWIDGQRYVRIAKTLLLGQGFGSLEMNKISVPAQPLLIATFLGLFDGSYSAVRMGFAALGSAACVVAFRLGARVFEPRIGLVTGWILALYPLHAYTSALFEVPQSFFVLATGGAFLFLYRYSEERRKRWLFPAGALFGVSALAVPTVLPFLPWVIVWLALTEPRKSAWPVPMAAFSLGVIAALSPWTIRNYQAYGHPILVNVAGGENFWKANNPTYFEHGKLAVALPCESGTRGEAYCAELARVQTEASEKGLSENEAILYADRAGWQGGIRYMRQYPISFLQLTGRKLLTLFSPRPDAVSPASAHGSKLQLLVSALSYLPILLFGFAGIVETRHRWRSLFPVYAYLLTLTVLYSLFVPTIRYRLPIDFFLILFAAHRLVRMLSRAPADGPSA